MIKKYPTELSEHFKFMKWASLNWRIRDYIFHIPNGGKFDPKLGGKLKAMGVRKGVSDFFIPLPVGSKLGLWIELKRVKGGKLSEEQADWLQRMLGVGYDAAVCCGADEAIKCVEQYLARTI